MFSLVSAPDSIEHNIGVLSIKIASPNRRCLCRKSKGNRSYDGQRPVLGSSQQAQPPHQHTGTKHHQGHYPSSQDRVSPCLKCSIVKENVHC